MNDFAGYVCWEPDDVEAVVAPVVESANDAAFLATHQSLPIIPEISKHFGRKETVTEPEVLEEFSTFDRDPTIMAVVGPPGSGKSHLIKWLHANLKSRHDALVLYVPRQDTSLQLVLRRVLADLPGEEAQRLRQDISKATDNVAQRPELAKANVLSLIANRLEYDPPTVHPDDEKWRQLLTGWDGHRNPHPILSNWLRADIVRPQLLASDSVIGRNVRTALSEYRPDDASTPVFLPEHLVDLPIPPGLNPNVHTILKRLKSNTSDGEHWRNLAACMLNDCLDEAIRTLIGLSSTANLVEAMSTARQILQREGRNLMLLIEDFALFDRIGQPLIDALVTPRGEDRCGLRTAFAITDDPYKRLGETLRSRVGCLYKTGVPFDELRGDTTRLIDFVGRYLNAVRVGAAKLDTALNQTAEADIADGQWVPDACRDCQFKPECHSREGFGDTNDGYGLYPLNRAAANRLVTAALTDGKFMPRTLLAEVLVPMLKSDAEAIKTATFPTRSFESRADRLTNGRAIHPVTAEVVKQLEDERDAHKDRRVRALRFWLEGFTEKPVDLGEPIHTAFGLPPLGVEQIPENRDSADEPSAPPPPLAPPTAPELYEIDRWAADADFGLPTATTEKLQSGLLNLVRGHIRWNDHLISPSNKDVHDNGLILARESFVIERSAGARRPNALAVCWDITANAESAVLLKSVIRLGSNDFFTSSRDYVLLQTQVARWSSDVLKRCETFTADTFPLDAAVQCLIMCAWLAGAPPEAYTDPSAALVAAISTPLQQPPAGEKPPWKQLAATISTPDRETLRQRFLDWTRAAQGTRGEPQAFDLARWLPTARRFIETLEFAPASRTSPTALIQLRAQFAHNLRNAVLGEAELLLHLHDSLDWGSVRDQQRVSDALCAAVNDAGNRGVFEPGERRSRFAMECEDFGRKNLAPLETLTQQAPALRAPFSPLLIRAVVDCLKVAPLASDTLDFLEDAKNNLDRSIAAADREIQKEFSDATPEQALSDLSSALHNLGGLVQTIAGWSN